MSAFGLLLAWLVFVPAVFAADAPPVAGGRYRLGARP